MALIKCSSCGKEISSSSKRCVHCGFELKKEEVVKDSNYKGENYGLAIAGFICSFFFPILGLIFGIVVLCSNKDNEECSAKSFGLASVLMSSIFMFIILVLVIPFLIFGLKVSKQESIANRAYSSNCMYATNCTSCIDGEQRCNFIDDDYEVSDYKITCGCD